MALKSIRWRLPVSYAGIALFSALALGMVLISILRSYYNQQERFYLQGNAQEIADMLGQETNSNLPSSTLKDQISSWSFLLQARLQYLDKDGKVLADSGIPDNQQKLVVSSIPVQGITVQSVNLNGENKNGQSLTNSQVALPGWGIFVLNSSESIPVMGTTAQIYCTQTLPGPGTPVQRLCAGGGELVQVQPGSGLASGSNTTIVGTPSPMDPSMSNAAIAMTMSNSIFGFSLTTAANASGQRSSTRISQLIRDASGNQSGMIILSDGLAFGDEIMDGIIQGWLFASLIAVLLAAAAGWWVSRRMIAPLMTLTVATTSMAAGDLTVRAVVQSADEFGELSRSFNGMAERVEEMVGTLRGFVADAAHQLMTPLTALRTNLELASGETDVRQRSGYLSSAGAQMARIEALVNGLLELSRLEAGGFTFNRERFDLRQVMHEIAETSASRAEQAGLQFDLDLPDAPVEMDGDEIRIRHALENLLDNAIKFTPGSGSVRLRLAKEQDWLVASVEDTGSGIPAEDLPHVFERFHRGRNSAGILGSGLGLAIVKAIVEMHQGQVTVQTTANGTRVELRFVKPL